MDPETLSNLSLEQLVRIAEQHGVDIPDDAERALLEEMVAEAIEEHRQEHRRNNNHQVRIEETKYETSSSEPHQAPDEPELDGLPESYNETRIVLILRDPSWAFAYWDIRSEDRKEFQKDDEFEGLLLRVFSATDPGERITKAHERFDIPVTLFDNRWYINLPEQQVHFRIALIAITAGEERILAKSNVIWAPKGALADAHNGDARVTDEILAQTGIQDLDVPDNGKRVPQRILDLVDEDLSFS